MERKRKTSRVRIKDKEGKRGDDRGEMAISAINNNKEVDKKSKRASNNNSYENIVSNPTVSTQRSKEEEERQGKEKITKSVNTTSVTDGISEVFDSSKYDVMTQMKSSTMNEEKLKEISSNIEKIKPIKAESIEINNPPSSRIDINASSAEPSPSNVYLSLEERAALLRGSKKEIMSDQNLIDSKSIASRLDEEEKRRRVDVEQQQQYNSLNSFTSPYVSLWRESVNMWTNVYAESVRNTAKMSEYWLDLFSKPWSGQYKQKHRDKVKVE